MNEQHHPNPLPAHLDARLDKIEAILNTILERFKTMSENVDTAFADLMTIEQKTNVDIATLKANVAALLTAFANPAPAALTAAQSAALATLKAAMTADDATVQAINQTLPSPAAPPAPATPVA